MKKTYLSPQTIFTRSANKDHLVYTPIIADDGFLIKNWTQCVVPHHRTNMTDACELLIYLEPHWSVLDDSFYIVVPSHVLQIRI